MLLPVILSFLLLSVRCKVYFHEKVDDGFLSRWVQSKSSSVSKHGSLVVEKSEYEDDEYFVKTSVDSSHYQYGTTFSEPLDTSKNTLVFQYLVMHPQSLDCGGAYVKLYGAKTDFSKFDGETPYHIMFGPDFCGYSTRKVHFILNHGGKNHEVIPEIAMVLDKKPHLYTLILHNNKTFQVLIDNEPKQNGTLFNNFNILPPKTIPDPEDKKPEDWADEEYIPDPNEKKPSDWVELKTIVDPNATKPGDWNDETDGEWQPDSVPNPDYKGEWEPKSIKNPLYKGVWEAKKIPNPDFKEDPSIGNFQIHGIGLENWQVKAGSCFDEFYVSDNDKEANEHAKLVMERSAKISAAIDKKEDAEREKLSEERKKGVKKDDEVENEVDDDEEVETTTEEAKGAEDEDYKSEL